MSLRRWWPAALAGTAAVVVASVVVASVVVGSGLKSPRQAAADAAPPPPSTVTIPAELRALVEPVVLRGQVLPGAVEKVLAPPAAIGPDSVVTAVSVRSGQVLREGQVVADRSGQPMITLVLPFPMYRDLVGGMSGPDVVVEVQKALSRLGYRIQANGLFNVATQNAISRLYNARGYVPPPGPEAASRGLPEARAAVAAARRALDAARVAGTGEPAAKAALDEATKRLADAELAAGPVLSRSGVLRLDRAGRKITKVVISVGFVLASADTALLELDGEPPFVFVEASKEQVGLLRVGQSAKVLDEQTGVQAQAVVAYAYPDLRPPTALMIREPHYMSDVTIENRDTPRRRRLVGAVKESARAPAQPTLAAQPSGRRTR